MAFLYNRENSCTILVRCPSSHLLLPLLGISAVLTGETQNLGAGSWQTSKRGNIFSIPWFKINMLQIWETDLGRCRNDADWFSFGMSPLKPLFCHPWWHLARSPVLGAHRHPRKIWGNFFQGHPHSKMSLKNHHPLSPGTNPSHPPEVSKM